jgi:hypothetical protein
VEQIDALNGARKVFPGKVPDPFVAAQDHLLPGAAPAAFPSLDVEPLAELLGVFDGAGIGGRVWVANRIACFVPLGLSEHAAEFDLGVWGGKPSGLPLRPAVSFLTTGTPVPSICTYRMGRSS